MSSLDRARETQLKNIETKTGKSLEQLRAVVKKSGLTKHGEIRSMLQKELKLGYGDANMLVFFALQSDGQSLAEAKGATAEAVLDGIYSGNKAPLRPIHDKLIAAIEKFGGFETIAKKGYVSLRRKRQFAMIGPPTVSEVEVGLNVKTLRAKGRLVAVPQGGMCQFKVRVKDAGEVDGELIGWIKEAFEAAGN